MIRLKNRHDSGSIDYLKSAPSQEWTETEDCSYGCVWERDMDKQKNKTNQKKTKKKTKPEQSR